MLTLTEADAKTMMLAGATPPEPFQVDGDLDLSNRIDLTHLPDTLRKVRTLKLNGCRSLTQLPDNLDVHALYLNDCTTLKALPAGLKAYQLEARNSGLTGLPDDLQVSYKLDLTGCSNLEELPVGLKTGSLILNGCISLARMPDGLHVYFLDTSNCVNLREWGATGTIEVGNITLAACGQLTYLPDWMRRIARLNIQECSNLRELPENLVVTSMIELANSGITELPRGCKNAELRWRDVIIDERIAFKPETIAPKDVLKTRNIELRRVMLERIGYEEFFEAVNAEELDRDVDPGGVRRLLRVEFEDTNRWQRDEPLVCLNVICPSTARKYIIRVPPDTKTCHQAAAWIAGFDDPAQYHPLKET